MRRSKSSRPKEKTVPKTATRKTAVTKDKLLFTPGPLTTSASVKKAMLRDLGSRDRDFRETVWRIRVELLSLAGVSREKGYEAILMQGSGTFGVEAVISSAVPPGGRLLSIVNGAYGERITKIAKIHGIDTEILRYAEHAVPVAGDVDALLTRDASITTVAIVHLETTTGILNPIESIGQVVKKQDRTYFVDSMSAFGGIPFDLPACQADFMVSSSNKCIEGVPGFSFAICRKEALLGTEGHARTLSLDLLDQWKGLEKNGQFRFTPPTHSILAFEQALHELHREGGIRGRARRYRENYRVLIRGMRSLGFEELVDPGLQGYIITSFRYPEDPAFRFEDFYDRLSGKGFVIYPGKVSHADCFRIGNIGRLKPSDIRALLRAVKKTLGESGVRPKPSHAAAGRSTR